MVLLSNESILPEATLPKTGYTVVIPVANPNTVSPLLDIAEKLIYEDEGQIILLYVTTNHDPYHRQKISAFERVLDTQSTHTAMPLDFVTYHADTVADGILSVAQSYHADMILLGLRYSIRGQVELGRIVETVVQNARCDVGVYRSPSHPYIDRIVIPVGGSIASKVILNIGTRLAEAFGFPSEALHIYSAISPGDARAHVENLLATIPHHEDVRVNVVHGVNEATGVLSWANESDLMVIGFSERSPLEKWLYGDTAQCILDRARGPVLMVSRAIDDAEIQALSKRQFSWMRPLLTETEQEHIVWLAKDTVLPTLDYFLLLIIAAVLASLGLLLNSSAVIIGAMLVAPLMQPIIALGIGLCTARLNLMRKASVTITLSVMMSLAVGFIVGILIPPDAATDEMLARAYPSLLDAAVALASGFIGAYATARKDIPAALAGVAIAAALVPPLCTVGLSIALLEPRLVIGSGLLFVTNLLCITVVAGIVFFWMGMRPTRLNDKTRRFRYATLLTGMLCVMLLVGGLLNYTHKPSIERISQTRLQAIFEPGELAGLHIVQQDPLLVIATVRTPSDIPPESVRMAQVMLSEDFDTDVRLRIVVQRVIDGHSLEHLNMSEAGIANSE